MKSLITLLSLISFLCAGAQNTNKFLNRDFWKSEPSVLDIKNNIKDGNDPTEKGPSSFDGVAYAIIDNAPIESIKYMLSLEGNPVTKRTHGGVQYLQWAAYKGNLEVMKHLLKLGANPNASTSRGTNMLLMAAIGGVQKSAVYDLILKEGISLNYTNMSGSNALLLLSGATIKDTSIFQYFIDKKISLDIVDKDGNNLFFYAAKGGNIKTMKFWRQKGVAYNAINNKGENAVLFASQGMKRKALRLDVFKYLSEELDIEVDQVSWEGKTPLHLSARRGSPELFNFFMSKGVSANQIDKNGNIALINAVAGSRGNLEKILANSNNIAHQDKLGKSAITIAIERGKKENFDFLLSKAVDLNVKDIFGNDLMYYVFKSHTIKKTEVTQHFINSLNLAGLNGKKTYENGNTLAHIAIEKHSVFLLEKAIEMGTNINFKNNINISPLHLAAMKAKNKELIDVLLNNGAEKNTFTDFNESPYDLALQNELLNKGNIDFAYLKLD
tara:strand:+ start:606 stop:2099 length:1494 start_codon:yes stop_codon:yes gene_type:complete